VNGDIDNIKISLKNKDKVLVLHHWDCDGLCSAAMMFNYLKEINGTIDVVYFLPGLGHYFLVEKDFLKIQNIKPDIIFIVDMALQKKDILVLKSMTNELYIFDHHKQQRITEVNHINPQTTGNINSLDYPSAGWVINDFFKKGQNILSVLGAIGDQESRVKNNNVIKTILDATSLTFSDCSRIIENIDSCYVTGNKEEMYYIVEIMKNKTPDLNSILKNSELLKNKKLIKNSINKIIDEGFIQDDEKGIIIKWISSNFHIISDITRKLSKKYPEYLIITVNKDDNDLANMYFRTADPKEDLSPILNYAKANGYNAGGKKEVVGIFCPVTKIEEVIKDTLNILHG